MFHVSPVAERMVMTDATICRTCSSRTQSRRSRSRAGPVVCEEIQQLRDGRWIRAMTRPTHVCILHSHAADAVGVVSLLLSGKMLIVPLVLILHLLCCCCCCRCRCRRR